MRYAVIMAGGSGTRLWPLSRRDTPKQLIRFITRGGDAEPKSLLALAADRLDGLVAREGQFICTGEAYREAIRRDLPRFTDDRILGEPMGRDTVNAVGFAAAVLEKIDPGAVFAVVTADHIIEPVTEFQRLMDMGFRLVEEDSSRLVTFSIRPTYPATGFGYVRRGRAIPGIAPGLAFEVERFEEKPVLSRAESFVQGGMHGWNSGMFVWKASTVMACLRAFKPESYDGLRRIQAAWGTANQSRVLAEVYPTLPKVSVDFAVMEPATHPDTSKPVIDGRAVNVCTVLMDLTWLDVGSWPSFAETLKPDADGNRTADVGGPGAREAILVDARNTLVVNSAKGHTLTVLGARDLIIVHTPDATLVMPASHGEGLKALHATLPPDLA